MVPDIPAKYFWDLGGGHFLVLNNDETWKERKMNHLNYGVTREFYRYHEVINSQISEF